ncbi:MAG: polysaccharide biosynthesis/export family protein [Pseudomonadota bacterium]
MCLTLAALLGGCSSRAPGPPAADTTTPEQLAREAQARQQTDELNSQLARQSSRMASSMGEALATEYRIGPGDALEIDVFQVQELSDTVRVSSRGTIMMPLLGSIRVAGRSAAEVEAELTALLGADYLQNPQVSVFVSDYRSSEVIIAGAVRSPAVYSITRPHSLVEVLLLAGGVADDAGYKVNVQTSVPNPETGVSESVNVIVDLRTLLDDQALSRDLLLRGGDSVFVQRAGFVFVQGAVNRSGAFKIEGEMNVLKALAMAGGISRVADVDDIAVFREDMGDDGPIKLDYNVLQENRESDIVLNDGDLVVVGDDALKTTFYGFVAVSAGVLPWIRIF